MASTSAPRGSNPGRIKSAASSLYTDSNALISDIRKAVHMLRDVAIDLEQDSMSDKVKQLDNGTLDLLKATYDCTHLCYAIQSIGNEYQPGPELTNFGKLFDNKIERSRATAPPFIPEKDSLFRQFREAIWKVHHNGEDMPGDEQEDIVMTSTQSNLLNSKCPLTGKLVIDLADPVRSQDCKHIFEKQPIMRHISVMHGECPIAGCPKILRADRVVCDPLLLVDIEEMRSMSKQGAGGDVIEDFTALDED